MSVYEEWVGQPIWSKIATEKATGAIDVNEARGGGGQRDIC